MLVAEMNDGKVEHVLRTGLVGLLLLGSAIRPDAQASRWTTQAAWWAS
jgi:hypothetical protein